MSAATRYSALGSRFARLPFGRRFSVPLPDGTIDQADRQQLGFVYNGILAEAPPAPTVPTSEYIRRAPLDDAAVRRGVSDDEATVRRSSRAESVVRRS